MATPIIVNPTQPSQVVVNGTQKSGTPIKVTTDLDYNRVHSMIDEKIGDIDMSAIAKEATLLAESAAIKQAIAEATPEIDTTELAKESTLQDESATIQSKIDNIDLTHIESKIDDGVNILSTKIDESVAKQGENHEATNSKIYEAVKNIPDLSLLYAARAEKNDDGANTYSIVLPVTAKVTYDNNGVATIQL